eukprot:614993-Rhodomonas_salina.1
MSGTDCLYHTARRNSSVAVQTLVSVGASVTPKVSYAMSGTAIAFSGTAIPVLCDVRYCDIGRRSVP